MVDLKVIMMVLILVWATFKLWVMTSTYDWHQEEDRKHRRLMRPVMGTKEEIEHGLKTGEYILWGNEIHLSEAHFPTKNPEYPTAFKVSWKIDSIIKKISLYFQGENVNE